MIWGIRRAFGMRDKLHPASIWLDIVTIQMGYAVAE